MNKVCPIRKRHGVPCLFLCLAEHGGCLQPIPCYNFFQKKLQSDILKLNAAGVHLISVFTRRVILKGVVKVAHYEKFSRQGLGHIFLHLRRGYRIGEDGQRIYVNYSNKEIDTSRSHLNYNLNLNEQGVPANQQKMYERILRGDTLPEGYSLTVNNRKDLKVLCRWVVSLPDDVKKEDERKFFQAVYVFLKGEYQHCVVPVFYDKKKDIYKISANELITRSELKTFHDRLSKAVESSLGYKVSIMTGESSLRREQGLRGSIDMLKYKAMKMAEEYANLKERVQASGLKLSADMAKYITETGQRERFAEYQRQKQQDEKNIER